MSEMVERVVASQRELKLVAEETFDPYTCVWFLIDRGTGSKVAGPFGEFNDAIKECERINARAAIAAMREPNSAMSHIGILMWEEGFDLCWKAAIDEALRE